MNNKTRLLHLDSITTLEHFDAESRTSIGTEGAVPDEKIEIRQSRLLDAELFSTYEPVNQKSILPVHQMLF